MPAPSRAMRLLIPLGLLAGLATGTATAQLRPPAPQCPSDLAATLTEARAVRALYLEAETLGQKPEACARALVYVRLMQRAVIASRATPAGCAPANPVTAAQYFTREQTIWRAKVQRQCPASLGPRQQQKIIRVTP